MIDLSIVKVNEEIPFQFPANSEPGYPAAPFLTACLVMGEPSLMWVRMIVFIDSSYPGTPWMATPSISNGIVSFTVNYDLSESVPPTNFTAWLVEFKIQFTEGTNQVEGFLCNEDPRTSRGTITTVLTK